MSASAPPEPPITPDDALKLLIAGNERWASGQIAHPHQSVERRDGLRDAQHPFATIFSCIDSRLPPEIVFDQGLGDLAVIRTGAQVLDDGVVLGSLEFSPDHLGAPLMLIMGHQRCGAVNAAIHTIQAGATAPGHIQTIVDALRPAYDIAVGEAGDLVDNMVRAHTKLTVERVRTVSLIERLVARGELIVAGGYYSLDTGAVSIIA
ncbi:MAG: carbonic anhydrase [Solirubrobacteraceae bacterium]